MNSREELNKTLGDHLLRCSVPQNLIRKLIESASISQNKALDSVNEWLAGDESTLVLLGGTGCGKSLASGHALAQNTWTRSDVFWRMPGDMPAQWGWNGGYFCDVKRDLTSGHANIEEVFAIRRRATATTLLVLDEAGSEAKDAEEAIFSILADRTSSMKRSIITANLNPEAFKARYGLRLISRILGSGRIVNVHGPDLRLSRQNRRCNAD